MTDAFDTDKGEFDAGKANGKFGDVTNTEWHTVVSKLCIWLKKINLIQKNS
ncbi:MULTISPECIES: hypothetical protein [Bacillus]|uniref:hypothetical protein n=1 Tax=Bacillus TaxID=1386 RepID=UPI0001A186D4|nr:hypothetical protein [Bacillus pseudomycoides]EEM13631.1 Surface protein, LPXTG-motif cell wall anchor domain protein [Bacillus pseudomycoides DSM 12442]MED1594037.1 hypothetical protein [Bacillus pseudomycoides]MED4714634.1 hypothetical protein [Bacillus pseudomycoides]